MILVNKDVKIPQHSSSKPNPTPYKKNYAPGPNRIYLRNAKIGLTFWKSTSLIYQYNKYNLSDFSVQKNDFTKSDNLS